MLVLPSVIERKTIAQPRGNTAKCCHVGTDMNKNGDAWFSMLLDANPFLFEIRCS
jgi:hypothetical protein